MNIDFLLDNYRELNIVCLVGVSEGMFWLGGGVWRHVFLVWGWVDNVYRWAGVDKGMFRVVGGKLRYILGE